MNESDMHVLGVVMSCGPCTTREIASHCPDETPGSIATILKRLASRGLVDGTIATGKYQTTPHGDGVVAARPRNLLQLEMIRRPAAIAATLLPSSTPPAPTEPLRQREKIYVKSLAKRQIKKIHDALRGAVDAGNRLAWTRLMIFGLGEFCGMRASEIAGLNVGDLDIDVHGDRQPVLRVRRETTKSDAGKRTVALDWNVRFLSDVVEYLAWRFGPDWQSRREELANQPFIVSFRRRLTVPVKYPQTLFSFVTEAPGLNRPIECFGRRLSRFTVRKYAISAIAIALDVDRYRATTHLLRHSCGTMAMEHGRSPAKVMEMLGHKNLKTLSIYTHAAWDASDRNCMGPIYANA